MKVLSGVRGTGKNLENLTIVVPAEIRIGH